MRLIASVSFQAGLGDAGARTGFADDARVVERDVEPAIAGDGERDERLCMGFRPDVAGERDGVAAVGADLGDEGFNAASRRAPTTSLAPSAANSLAVARPMPSWRR